MFYACSLPQAPGVSPLHLNFRRLHANTAAMTTVRHHICTVETHTLLPCGSPVMVLPVARWERLPQHDSWR